MGQRSEPRKAVQVSVRIFGTNASGKPFSENVATLNVSRGGVLLGGVQAALTPGEIVGLAYGSIKARFTVKWVGEPNTPRQHQVGLQSLSADKSIWDFPLPSPSLDDFGRGKTAAERRQSPRLKCVNSVELHPDGQDSPIWGKVTELGMGGCFIEMPIPLRQATKLKIGLWIKEIKFWMRGKVVSSRPGFGIGVQFTEIADGDKESLRTFLASITHLRPPRR